VLHGTPLQPCGYIQPCAVIQLVENTLITDTLRTSIQPTRECEACVFCDRRQVLETGTENGNERWDLSNDRPRRCTRSRRISHDQHLVPGLIVHV
jgi:hypothetical protein